MIASNQEERARFADRLKQAMTTCEIEHSPIQLALIVNAHSSDEGITVDAARKWLLGEAIPLQGRLRFLATALNVDSAWLRFGDKDVGDELVISKPNDLLVLADEIGQLSAEDKSMLRGLTALLLTHQKSPECVNRFETPGLNF